MSPFRKIVSGLFVIALISVVIFAIMHLENMNDEQNILIRHLAGQNALYKDSLSQLRENIVDALNEKDSLKLDQLRQQNKTKLEQKQSVDININGLVHAEPNDYSVKLMGGIKDLIVTAYNNSDYPLTDYAVIIKYYKSNGDLFQSQTIHFYHVSPHSHVMQPGPDSDRGTRVAIVNGSIITGELPVTNSQ
jgi:hypothetical protein